MQTTASSGHRPGSVIAGRYEVDRLLGRGGMAEVYLATDRLLDRPVAVKVIREHLAEDHKVATRLRREARAAAALNHRNIVAVHDVGTDQGRPFIVMEHVRGKTLADLLREQGPFPPDRVAAIGEDAARALAMAHDAGIIHRDVKPANVMITDDEVKILDFGIAHAFRWTPITEAPAVQGTAEYMAPEQIRGHGSERRSDIYSLGAVLFELATGRPPFSADTPLAIAYRHLEDTPPAPQSIRPEVPPELATILLRCLSKRPDDRYRRADDLAEDLARFRAGQPPVTAPVPSRPTQRLDREAEERPHRPRRRTWWVVAAVVLVVAVGATVVALVALRPRFPTPLARKEPLRPPTHLSAQGTCGGLFNADVTVRWRPTPTMRADGYEVYRGTESGGPYERVGIVEGRAATSFVDGGVGQNATYYYVVRGIDGRKVSPASSQAQAATPTLCLG